VSRCQHNLDVAKLGHLRGALLVCHVIGYTVFSDGPAQSGPGLETLREDGLLAPTANQHICVEAAA